VWEHFQFIVVIESSLPAQCDRKELALLDLELLDFEGWRQNGAHDGAAT